MQFCFHVSPAIFANARAAASVPAPGDVGQIQRTGLLGKSATADDCARACIAGMKGNAAKAAAAFNLSLWNSTGLVMLLMCFGICMFVSMRLNMSEWTGLRTSDCGTKKFVLMPRHAVGDTATSAIEACMKGLSCLTFVSHASISARCFWVMPMSSSPSSSAMRSKGARSKVHVMPPGP